MNFPKTKKENVEEIIFSKKILDPYRWMENQENPELYEWIDKQNTFTENILSEMPKRDEIKTRLKTLYDYEKYGVVRQIGEYIVFSKHSGLDMQPTFYIQKGLEGKEEVLINPNKLSEDGTVSLTINGASKDNRYLSFLKSESGSDWQEIIIIDLIERKQLKDIIKNVKFTLVSWLGDGFYYSSYDRPDKGKELSAKNENMKIYYHTLGRSQAEDELIFNEPENPLHYNSLQVSKDSKYLILNISKGTYGNEVRIKHTEEDAQFKTIFKGFNYEYNYIGECEGLLYFLTDENALNKKIININPNTLEIKDFIKEGEANLQNAWKFEDKFILLYLKDVISEAFLVNSKGDIQNKWELKEKGVIYDITGSKYEEELLFSFGSFTVPLSIMSFNKRTYQIKDFKKPSLDYDANDFKTEQVFYESKDGTKVPVFLTYKKGLSKDKKRPTLLYGYGGFNLPLVPGFNPSNIFLIEQGGIYAHANIRGGSEYGEKWHKEGMLLKKQNVFDDFISIAENLIKDEYTSPDNLFIQGGSNGGLLIGAVTNQRPDLFKAAFPQVGVMDMLRYHLFTIGWGWMVEYGNPEEEEHFNNLLSYSPLHNIEEKDYPAIMVMTADHDDRVVPAHSFKYIATLQEKNTSNNPVIIRVDKKAGHGAGKSVEKVIDEQTDKLTFMGLGKYLK